MGGAVAPRFAFLSRLETVRSAVHGSAYHPPAAESRGTFLKSLFLLPRHGCRTSTWTSFPAGLSTFMLALPYFPPESLVFPEGFSCFRWCLRVNSVILPFMVRARRKRGKSGRRGESPSPRRGACIRRSLHLYLRSGSVRCIPAGRVENDRNTNGRKVP